MTTSSRGLPYAVYKIPLSTAGDVYPSPSGLFQITRGPLVGQVSFRPVASVWKFRCGPPHCVQGMPAGGAASRGTRRSRTRAGAAKVSVRNVRRSMSVPFDEQDAEEPLFFTTVVPDGDRLDPIDARRL